MGNLHRFVRDSSYDVDFDLSFGDRVAALAAERRRKAPPPGSIPCTCGVCGRAFISKGARRAHCRDKHTVST